MRTLLRINLVASMLAAAAFFAAGPAGASCIELPPLGDGIDGAAAVFVGTVTGVSNLERTAQVTVTEVWKGDVGAEVTVNGGPTSENEITSVDRSYAAGTTYLFVTHAGSGTEFEDNACSHTQPWGEDLAAFRPADAHPPVGAPDVVVPAESAAQPWSWALATLAIAGGVAVVGGALWFGLRRRQSRRVSGPGVAGV